MTPSSSPSSLRVGIVSHTFFYLPLWAAIEHGWFEQSRLQVAVSLLGNASQAEPLKSGELHVAIATPETALQDAAAGGALRIIAGNTGKLSHSLITRSPFRTVESLRGATIGILNMVEGSFFQLRAMMAHHGLMFPGDYQVKETGGVPPRHKALLEGSIDAGLQSIPWNYVAEEAGMNNLGDINGYVPDWQFVSVNVNREWARANQDVLVKFLSVLLRATEWVHAHKEEAAAIAQRELPAKEEHARRAWDYYTSTDALTRDMSVNERGLQVVLQTQREAGLLSPDAPQDVAFYVDPSWLEAARRQAGVTA